jgi:RNA polymerase sigma factor (sigma-70 family)
VQAAAPCAPAVLTVLTRSAAAGDERAWRELVTRFEPMLRGVVRGFRLDPADAEDVIQTTWIRAFRNLDRLNEPAAIGAWLAVTARREALRTLQRGVREVLADEPRCPHEPDADTPESSVLERERQAAVRAAVRRLRGRQRLLLATMIGRPGASYDELSETLDMPTGSIGPTRERALGILRRDPALAAVVAP